MRGSIRVGVESASSVVVVEMEVGSGSARVNSRSSRSSRTSGDSTSALQDADASAVVCEVKKVLLLALLLLLLDVVAAWVRARAAGVEDTAACAGRKELSEGVWFKLNVVELGPGVADVDADADVLSGVEGSSSCASCVLEAVEGSCMEEMLSEVGMWTWAACSKKEVQNLM